MALSTPVDRGTVTITENPGTTNTRVSGSFTPAPGSLLVVLATMVLNDGNGQATLSVSDTFTGTTGPDGTGTWRQDTLCGIPGTFSERVSIFTARAGSTPAGTITLTCSNSTSILRMITMTVIEFTGQEASNFLNFASNSGATTTLTVTLPATPLAASALVGVLMDDGSTATNVTAPTGFTEVNETDGGAGVGAGNHEAAYKLLSNTAANQWTTLSSGAFNIAAILEISAIENTPPPPVFPRGQSPSWQWAQRRGADEGAAAANAQAEVAAGTGEAFDATTSIAPDAEVATGTGAAGNAKATVAPNAGNAAGTGTAFNAGENVAPTAGVAAGTGTALNPGKTVAPVAEVAAGTGTAFDATAVTGSATNAPAECATGTGTAYNATANVAPSAGNAAGTGTAFTAKTSVVASATSAAGTGTAFNATVTISPTAGAAAGTGTAFNATATTSGNTFANAEVATGTGSAFDAKTTIAANAGLASGTGTAYDATGGATAGSGTGATFLARVGVTSTLILATTATGIERPAPATVLASPAPGSTLVAPRLVTEIVE